MAINKKDVEKLLIIMRDNNYSDSLYKKLNDYIVDIDQKCQQLYSRDFQIQLIDNKDGSLCAHYPPSIIIPLRKQHSSGDKTNFTESEDDCSELHNHMKNSRMARCRTRFVVPSILYKGKYVCRSATLSGSFEICGRQAMQAASDLGATEASSTSGKSNGVMGKELFDKLRGCDVGLLRTLNIHYICDFMVEKRKTKMLLPVSSSEKIDSHKRYKEFTILTLPYPGCEFFREWREQNCRMDKLYFNWKQSGIDAELDVSQNALPIISLETDWKMYKFWDLTEMTLNYIKLMLGLLVQDPHRCEGLLVHCVSGWDRTPLFICILRVLLWSEQYIHNSLEPIELLYLTLGYDWFLFGHQFKTRLETSEDVLHFCFAFLEYCIDREDLSIRHVYDTSRNPETTAAAQSNTASDTTTDKVTASDRKTRLREICALFQSSYSFVIPGTLQHARSFGNMFSSIASAFK